MGEQEEVALGDLSLEDQTADFDALGDVGGQLGDIASLVLVLLHNLKVVVFFDVHQKAEIAHQEVDDKRHQLVDRQASGLDLTLDGLGELFLHYEGYFGHELLGDDHNVFLGDILVLHLKSSLGVYLGDFRY